MTSPLRRNLVATVVAVAVVLAAGCGEEASGPVSSPPSPGHGRTSSVAPAATTVTVNVARGRVETGSRRVKVPLGRTVRITITSDVAGEFHLHGYDRALRLKPGEPGTVELVADLPGVFEAELHGSWARLFELQVS
jgi:hypothetical protein